MKHHISKLLTSDKPYVPIVKYLMTFDYSDEDILELLLLK